MSQNRRPVIAVLVLTLLTSCADLQAARDYEQAASDCAARGGELGYFFPDNPPGCVVPYDDGGTSCTSSAQCQGTCLLPDETAEVGQCSAETVMDFCGQVFLDDAGVQELGICI